MSPNSDSFREPLLADPALAKAASGLCTALHFVASSRSCLRRLSISKSLFGETYFSVLRDMMEDAPLASLSLTHVHYVSLFASQGRPDWH